MTASLRLGMLRQVDQLPILGLDSQIWTPRKLNRHIRQLLESDYRLSDLWVAGEVSNLSQPASGHLYFSLTDAEASLRCVMWRSQVEALGKLPQDGEAVEVHGLISVYEAGGQYQLYADDLRLAGEGALYREFLRRKERLEREGLFDEARKRALPEWPKRIGVVTSATGAALQDVLNVLGRRYPLPQLILAPTPVQGEAAPGRIAEALAALNRLIRPDVILLVRGGGSMEDLWAFNTEEVVRAVVASEAPVVTGIGHETDIILADYAADRRAPTPSAAAELATPDREELALELDELQMALVRGWEQRRQSLRAALHERSIALRALSPQARVASARQQVDELLYRATSRLRHDLGLRRAAVAGLSSTLRAMGPNRVLARGYAVVSRTEDGAIVRSVEQVTSGAELSVRVSDGVFGARATGGDEDHG